LKKKWFRVEEDAPTPLRCTVQTRVRFEEVDALGIVWHGRYSSYFEDARVALGEKYGIGYLDFYRERVSAPIKQLHVDYKKPLYFGEKIHIEAILHWSPGARINCAFKVRNSEGELAAEGYSVQMMLENNEEILFLPPPFYADFLQRWQRGELA